MNPVAPSAVVLDGSQNLESGGIVGAQGKGGVPGPPTDRGNNSNDPGNGKNPNSGPPTNSSPTAPGLKKVEIEGLINSTGVDSITVNGQTVVVPLTCPIRRGSRSFTLADLRTGDRVHVTANKVSVGTAVTLEATEVKLQNPGESVEIGAAEPTNLISVTATDPEAGEVDGDTGTFTLARSGSATALAASLSVTFTLTGTAINGTDYASVPLTASFAAGEATTTVTVNPAADELFSEGRETVILTLDVTTPYELGSPASATVTISDAPAPLVSVTAPDANAREAGLDPGMFRFMRSVATATALTVTYTVTGTAQNGLDYQLLSGSVTIPAGAAFVDVPVKPIANFDAVGGNETVIVTLVDGPAYDLGTATTATVVIAP